MVRTGSTSWKPAFSPAGYTLSINAQEHEEEEVEEEEVDLVYMMLFESILVELS